MDIDKFVTEIMDLSICNATFHKPESLAEIRKKISERIKEALDFEIDQALLVVDRYAFKYKHIQHRGLSLENDATDKIVFLMIELIKSDLYSLQERK